MGEGDVQPVVIDVTALVTQAKAGLQEVVAGLDQVNSKLTQSEGVHQKHSAAVAHGEGALKGFFGVIEGGLGKLEGFEHGVERIVSRLGGFGIIGGVTGGLFGGLEMAHLITQTEQYDTDLSHLTLTFNGNTTAASQWMAVVQETGGSVQSLQQGVDYLSRNVDNLRPTFQALNIPIADAKGNFLSINQILNNVRQHFNDVGVTTTSAADALALFGRGGQALLPIMELTDQQFKAIIDEATRLGLVIDSQQLEKYREMDAGLQELNNTLHALEINLGHDLLPMLDTFAQAMTTFITDHLQQINHIVNQTISFIVGFVDALTGGTGAITDYEKALAATAARTTDVNAVTDTAAGRAAELKDAIRDLQREVTLHTQAIDDQIRSLEDANRAFERQINDQLALLQAQGQEQAYLDRIAGLKRKNSDDAVKLTELEEEAMAAAAEGNYGLLQDLTKQINDLRAQMSRNDLDMEKATGEEERRQKEETLRAELQQHKQSTDDQVEKLRVEQQQFQRAAQTQIDAMNDANSKVSAGFIRQGNLLADTVNQGSAQAGASLVANLDAASVQAGKDFEKEFGKALVDIQQTNWKGLGDEIGKAMGQGFVHGVEQAIKDAAGGAWGWLWHNLTQGRIDNPNPYGGSNAGLILPPGVSAPTGNLLTGGTGGVLGGGGGGGLVGPGGYGAGGGPKLGRSDLAALAAAAGGDWDPNLMARIALAESGGDPGAVGDTSIDPVHPSEGLWQIFTSVHRDLAAKYNLFDPFQNAEAAHEVWQSQGYQAWSTFNSGAYLQYMLGGTVPGLLGTPVPAILHAGESVNTIAETQGGRGALELHQTFNIHDARDPGMVIDLVVAATRQEVSRMLRGR